MSNDYFQFKQFRVGQERCAMKVTTDACIQGAWTPLLPHVKRVLDVGAGTGLLALMIAQRKENAIIDAIEIDEQAAAQASENIAASPWSDRVQVINEDVRNCQLRSRYDLIISNPPFFNNSLLSEEASRSNARHTTYLAYSELVTVVKVNLAPDGYASIMLPAPEYSLFKALAEEAGLHEASRLSVAHTSTSPVKRMTGVFIAKNPSFVHEEHLIIMDGSSYSQSFIDLLSPFYLYL